LIPVTPRPEPAGFDANVRRPGRAFLKTNPTPTNDDFKGHTHWKWAANELYEAYRRLCAYSCMYIPMPSGTIDHFLPKIKRPDQAYEWNNFRLALHRINTYKGNRTDVLDPFTVGDGWFILDFPSCLVRAGSGLTPEQKQSVETTIDALRLNDDDSFVQERCDVMMMFAQGDVFLPFLEKRYPFLAAEVVRQGIQSTAASIFKKPASP
jgi:hypothetical protein